MSCVSHSKPHVFVVLNPVAGNSSEDMARHLEGHFAAVGWKSEFYATTGQECIADVVRHALDRGVSPPDLLVAAGGDGTVSGVAGGAVRTGRPVGIVPLGTANTFARDLGIPLAREPALELLTGDHRLRDVDAMAVGEQFFVLNVSIGISGLMMRDTARLDRRRFGRAAYVWTGLRKLFGYQPHRFALTVDGDQRSVRAAEIAIVNSGALGDPSLRWSPQAELDDGCIDVTVVRAKSILDYLSLTVAVAMRRHQKEPALSHHVAEQNVVVDTDADLPVQADGEIIGQPPVTVTVVPSAFRVVVPPAPDQPRAGWGIDM